MKFSIACLSVLLVSYPAAFAQSAAPAAAAPQAVTTTASPEVGEFQKIEDAWSTAVNQHDQYGLENVLSPLFLGVAANGDISTRDQEVVQTLSNNDKSLWLSQKVISVRMMGDTAVANGTYLLRHQDGNKTVTDNGVFTHVFERTHNRWLCVNSQRTLVRTDGPPEKHKKSSSAAEPFHIPLFSHGK
ncbi:MAG: nuclear transport factor 2 family protein [Acidobacteriota bacterium]